MLYTSYLERVTACPFCKNRKEHILENKTAFLTFALAPYAPYHLLVVPKRHIDSFFNLTSAENADISKLLTLGRLLLKKLGCHDFSILVRQGEKSGKSISHLHYHLIPQHRIGDLDINADKRKLLTPLQVKKLIHTLSSAIKN